MMQVIYGIKNVIEFSNPNVVAIGVFDGVHIGHRKIIKQLTKIAREKGMSSVVVTFDPHPDKVIKGDSAVCMLSSLAHRIALIDELGVDICVVIKPDRHFLNKTAESFFRSILLDRLNAKQLVIGKRFSFGREQLDTRRALEPIAKNLGLGLVVVKTVLYRSSEVSSSRIRKHIERGRLKTASRLLGRRVSIFGRVIHGRKRGRILGFKTANIDPHHEAIPPSGVYAAYTVIDKKRYNAVVNIGRRPTFQEKDPSVEVHIFRLNRNLYNKDMEVFFVEMLRQEKRFPDLHKLREQIKKDAFMAQTLLAETRNSI
jgi:riboflavin kinase / FMN adenylyltransferase